MEIGMLVGIVIGIILGVVYGTYRLAKYLNVKDTKSFEESKAKLLSDIDDLLGR